MSRFTLYCGSRWSSRRIQLPSYSFHYLLHLRPCHRFDEPGSQPDSCARYVQVGRPCDMGALSFRGEVQKNCEVRTALQTVSFPDQPQGGFGYRVLDFEGHIDCSPDHAESHFEGDGKMGGILDLLFNQVWYHLYELRRRRDELPYRIRRSGYIETVFKMQCSYSNLPLSIVCLFALICFEPCMIALTMFW